MSSLEVLKDPSLINSLSLIEKLGAGIQVAVLGVVIVFIILIILILFLKIMEKLAADNSSIGKNEPAVNRKKKVKIDQQERKELIAVITAALYQAYYDSPTQFRVRRITRVEDNTPVWARSNQGGFDNFKGGRDNEQIFQYNG